MAGTGLLALMSVVGGATQLVNPRPGRPDPGRIDPLHLTVGGGLGFVVVLATAWAVVRWARAATVPPAPSGAGEWAEGDAAEEKSRRRSERRGEAEPGSVLSSGVF